METNPKYIRILTGNSKAANVILPSIIGGVMKLTAWKLEFLNRLRNYLFERSEFIISSIRERKFQVNFIQPQRFLSFLRFKKDKKIQTNQSNFLINKILVLDNFKSYLI